MLGTRFYDKNARQLVEQYNSTGLFLLPGAGMGQTTVELEKSVPIAQHFPTSTCQMVP